MLVGLKVFYDKFNKNYCIINEVYINLFIVLLKDFNMNLMQIIYVIVSNFCIFKFRIILDLNVYVNWCYLNFLLLNFVLLIFRCEFRYFVFI